MSKLSWPAIMSGALVGPGVMLIIFHHWWLFGGWLLFIGIMGGIDAQRRYISQSKEEEE